MFGPIPEWSVMAVQRDSLAVNGLSFTFTGSDAALEMTVLMF